MKDAKRKGISLRPGKDTEPEMIIDRILGPGLTVIGCELASYRHALMRQMAMAIATGHKFLDTFAVKKCKVLYIAGGHSEYMIFKNLVDFPTHALDLHKKWERFDNDCIGQLDSYFDKHRGLGAVFLGEYNLIKRRLPNNRENLLAAHELTLQREFEDINDIRDWSIANKVSVIVSHKLSTRGSLYYGGAITNRDNELKIIKRRGQWWLEVSEGSNYLTFGEWQLDYDDIKRSFSIKDPEEDGARKAMQGANENDELILEMVRASQHFPTNQEIEEVTGLPHSTAQGRLKSLEKRDQIVKIKDKPIRWMANPNISSLSMSSMVDK
jgi:hypothetical protein